MPNPSDRNRLTPEIAKEFLRVCKKADPSGEYSAIYRSNPLINQLWEEAVSLAKEMPPEPAGPNRHQRRAAAKKPR